MALVVKNPPANAGHPRHRVFDHWVGKIPWSRKWQPTPVFLPGESHGQRSLAGYSPWGCKESDTTGHTSICICFKRRNWLQRYGRTGKHQGNLVVVIAESSSFTWGHKGRRLEFRRVLFRSAPSMRFSQPSETASNALVNTEATNVKISGTAIQIMIFAVMHRLLKVVAFSLFHSMGSRHAGFSRCDTQA